MDKTQNTSRRTRTANSARAAQAARSAKAAGASHAAGRTGARGSAGSSRAAGRTGARGSAGSSRAAGRTGAARSAGSMRTAGRTGAARSAGSIRAAGRAGAVKHSSSAKASGTHRTAAVKQPNPSFLTKLRRAGLVTAKAAAFLVSYVFSGIKSAFGHLDVFISPGVLLPAVIKWASVVLIGLLLYGQLHVKQNSAAVFDTMAKTAAEAADLSNTVQGDNQMVRRLYGLTPSDYDGVLLYCPKTNMGAEELLLVRLKDKSQEKPVLDAIGRRLETQLASFNGYGVDQTEMLEKSVTFSEGGYCLFYSGNDPQKVRSAVKNAL